MRRDRVIHLAQGVLAVAAIAAVVPVALRFLEGAAGAPPPDQQRPPSVVLDNEAAAAAEASPDHDHAVPVLTFHDISPTPTSPYTVTPEQFAAHLAALARAGFHTVTLAQVEDLVAGRHPALPPKPILITFDDGAIGEWTWGDPILARHGFTAVAFVVTSLLDDDGAGSYYLDWELLGEMVRSGRWEVGGHTHNGHRTVSTGAGMAPWLTNLEVDEEGTIESLDHWEERVSADLAANRKAIEDALGIEVRAMAYPFSASAYPTNDDRVPERLPELVRERFSLGFTNVSSHQAVVPGAEPILLPRLASVTGDVSPAVLLQRLAAAVPQPPPPDPTQLSWAPVRAGSCTAAGGAVVVAGDRYVVCRPEVAHLERWDDYALTATVTGLDPGETALLAVRHRPLHRVEVAVGARSVVVRQQVEGEWSPPVVVELAPTSSGARAVSLAAADGQVSVVVDGQPVAVQPLSPGVGSGGIALGLVPGAPGEVRFEQVAIQAGG